MIYVDASHLHSHLRMEKPLSGVQRLTLNSLVGLIGQVGQEGVRVLLFDETYKFYGSCNSSDFFNSRRQNQLKLTRPSFSRSDRILLTEYFWNTRVTAACANRANFGESKVFRFIHDVIPLALPQYYPWTWVWKFRRFVHDAILSADVILTNSDFSLSDIRRHFPREMQGKASAVLKLPHEFLSVEDSLAGAAGQPTAKAARSHPPAAVEGLAGQDFALMVGSLEPRKNHEITFAAWRKVEAGNQAMPRLVVVGAVTSASFFWKRKIRHIIEQTPSIIHLQCCDDESLCWLYQSCRFSIFLSAYEGWGLPVGESLWFGKPVLSSNTTSLPEVGESMIDYIDPNNEDLVAAQLGSFIVSAPQPREGCFRRWDDFAHNLLAILN